MTRYQTSNLFFVISTLPITKKIDELFRSHSLDYIRGLFFVKSELLVVEPSTQ